MRISKERPSKSQNSQSFRISKLPPKIIPSIPSPMNMNSSQIRSSKSKYLLLQVPKTNDQYMSKSDYHDNKSVTSSQNGVENQQIDQASVKNLISVLMTKGPKFRQTIANYGDQISTWILQSESLSIKAHNIFEKMVDQRRLGADLKGLNSTLIAEIEKGLITTLNFEASMYQKQKDFVNYKNQIKDSLKNYKEDLLRQLEQIENAA